MLYASFFISLHSQHSLVWSWSSYHLNHLDLKKGKFLSKFFQRQKGITPVSRCLPMKIFIKLPLPVKVAIQVKTTILTRHFSHKRKSPAGVDIMTFLSHLEDFSRNSPTESMNGSFPSEDS